MFPSQRCAWIPPACEHAARSAGGVAGSMIYLSAEVCRGLPSKPCLLNSSGLLVGIIQRVLDWNVSQAPGLPQKRLIAVLRDEIRQPERQPLRLPIPKDKRLVKVAHALLDDVSDNRTLDEWGHYAGMA